jgi:hypothetical protein
VTPFKELIMPPTTLQQIADAIVRQAHRQGFVVARDIRTELKLAGLPEADWKAVAALAKGALNYRQGRYYHLGTVSPALQKEEERQRVIQKVIRQLLKHHRAAAKENERRGQNRIDFIQQVKVTTEDGKEFALLSRDLSPTGIRLLGTKQLLGQKVRVDLPVGEDMAACRILARILWTCAVGDDLFENGGSFLEVLPEDAGK